MLGAPIKVCFRFRYPLTSTRSYFSEGNSVSFPERYSKSENGWDFDIFVHKKFHLCVRQRLIRMDAALDVLASHMMYEDSFAT